MAGLSTEGGQQLKIGSGVATRLGPVGTTRFSGNFQSYASSPYQAFTGMFAADFASPNTPISATSDIFVNETAFPAATTFDWAVTPSPDWAGVNGYLHLDYGNYDDSVGGITPKQLTSIVAMSLNVGWTFTGSTLSGLLCECYPTTTSHATGSVSGADPVAEVGFFPKCSPASQSFAAGSTSVGSFTDVNGVVWNVGQAVSGVDSIPYFVATCVGYVDHHGPLDFKSYFTFLTGAGKLTGAEFFNGAAFGVEPLSGAGTLLISSYTPSYD
jgi:hypothetical protein